MKLLGLLLITAGFLAGSLVATQTPAAGNHVPWGPFALSTMVAIAGVALARFAARSEATHEGTLESGLEDLERSIHSVVGNIAQLHESARGEFDPYSIHGRIDELFIEDLNTFVEARESVAHVYGLASYAEMMNEYAAGERYLNRVWSASVDGYIDEVREYLGRASEQFQNTATLIDSLRSRGA